LKYRITGADGYNQSAADAASALTFARTALAKFKVIEVQGPSGRMTLAQLEAQAEAEKANADKT
jgi:hypothetical protein